MSKKNRFTLIEMMVVVMIIAILMSLLLPALAKARVRAKYTRWLAFNSMINRDPDAIINYNFEIMDYKVNIGGVMSPAVYNGASSCTAAGFDPVSYAGIISPRDSGPTWLRGGGRWLKLKNALLFDGVNDYVEVLGTKLTNFNPSVQDFTIIVWANPATLANQTLCSKTISATTNSQYNLFMATSWVRAIVGNVSIQKTTPPIEISKWHNIALVNSVKNGMSLYMNGKLMTGYSSAAVFPGDYVNNLTMLVGAAHNGNATNFVYRFRGRMDEFVMYTRALSKEEILGHYKMGTPD
ncbi:MAG: LamG-like jellyroll fold domain-containing protein [Victivallaceae bacterium]